MSKGSKKHLNSRNYSGQNVAAEQKFMWKIKHDFSMFFFFRKGWPDT
jgi:hypothetical protein